MSKIVPSRVLSGLPQAVAICAVLAMTMSSPSVALDANSSGETAFETIKKLAGNWTGKDDDNQPVTCNYEVSSGGTIVIEKLQTGTHPCMTSVYHRDGDTMMMTHYCNMNNQPRLRLKALSPERKTIDFDFVDITNLKSPKDGHIKSLSISLPDDTHMVHDWSFDQDGKEAHAIFTFERVKDTFDPQSVKPRPSTKQDGNPKKG